MGTYEDDRLPLPQGAMLKNERYEIQNVLGDPGGFAIAYTAADKTEDCFVAIKEFFPCDQGVTRPQTRNGSYQIVPPPGKDEEWKQGRHRFMNEALKMAKINDEHVVDILEHFDENNTVYLVMKLVEGETLAAQVERCGPLPWREVVDVACQTAQPLIKLHEQQNSIHQDVTPVNIMLTRKNGRWFVTLLDFGGVRRVPGPQAEAMMSLFGTPYFAPLEQWDPDPKKRGLWGDVYGLAATMKYALTMGKDYPDDVPEWLKQVLNKGMADDYTERTQTVQAFIGSFNWRPEGEAEYVSPRPIPAPSAAHRTSPVPVQVAGTPAEPAAIPMASLISAVPSSAASMQKEATPPVWPPLIKAALILAAILVAGVIAVVAFGLFSPD